MLGDSTRGAHGSEWGSGVALAAALIPAGGSGSGGAPPVWALVLIAAGALSLPALIVVLILVERRRKRIAHDVNLASGVPMTAKVLVLAPVGSGGASDPGLYRITLEVADPRGPFVVVVAGMVELQRLASVQVGALVPVRVAAADNVEIVAAGVARV